MWRFLRLCFSDSRGYPSSTRLIMGYVGFVIITVWAVECFRKNEVLPIDWTIVSLLLVAMGAKVIEKKKGESCVKD